MAYIADLAPYNYGPLVPETAGGKLLAVGWLEPRFPFTTGQVEQKHVRRLRQLALTPVNVTAGFHVCGFCSFKDYESSAAANQLGNGELWVKGKDDVVYLAPVLIAHYIETHHYRPPGEFLAALEGLPELRPIVIIAALKRELSPLIKSWPRQELMHQGRRFVCYESNYAVVVCGGIGDEYARAAAEAAFERFYPRLLISAGIAGALVPDLHVGDTVFPTTVIDFKDGSRHETAIRKSPMAKTSLGRTVTVTYPEIASAAQKRQLAKSYSAQVVDMEGAAVARAADIHNLPFIAIKTVSDEMDFEIHELNRFVRNGKFDSKSLVFYLLPRPWLWLKMIRLARNTRIASDNLCAWLRESALTNTIVPGGIERHQS